MKVHTGDLPLIQTHQKASEGRKSVKNLGEIEQTVVALLTVHVPL